MLIPLALAEKVHKSDELKSGYLLAIAGEYGCGHRHIYQKGVYSPYLEQFLKQLSGCFFC